ncbi:MAG: hypothetical protein R3Y27_04790 [Clostridia bacterium]
MNKNSQMKQYLSFSIVYAAIFAIYNIIVLMMFSEKNDIFWTSYAFMCVAFLVNVGISLYSFKALDVEAIFMGIPLLSLTIFYFFGELFISLAFMIFKSFASIQLTIAVQTIFMLIFIIASTVAIMSREVVSGVAKDYDTKSKSIKLLSVEVKLLEEQCLDKELKTELHKVTESIRYSDPMTNAAVADLDTIIVGKISELKLHCNSNNKNEALQSCYQLSSYLSERKQKLMLSK